ncbi:MAG: XRE family transcriptional regulator [Rickettsiales bacterium]|nr:MAG: XRE family transcriptional regulator [Rickettsiales bacterium]
MSNFIGSNLYFARMLNDLTLQDLANKIGLTKQYIQYLESETKTPQSQTIDLLSQFLYVNNDFFTNPLSNIPLEQIHFRKRKIIPIKIQNTFVAKINIIQKIIKYLESKINIPDIKLPNKNTDVNFYSLNIEQITKDIRKEWNLGKDPIPNLSVILENRGCIILSMNDIIDKIDACSIDLERPIIVRKKNSNICRTRFTEGHELGHIILHKGMETGDNETENQANRFSSALLLPEESFRQEFSFLLNCRRIDNFLIDKLINLKFRWGVSSSAIFRRAFDLEMIDSEKYKNICITYNTKIYNKSKKDGEKEKGDDDFSKNSKIREESNNFLNAIDILNIHNLIPELLNCLSIKKELLEKQIDYKIVENKGNIININFKK